MSSRIGRFLQQQQAAHARASAGIRCVVCGESFANRSLQSSRTRTFQSCTVRPCEHADVRVAFAAENELIDQWRETTQQLGAQLAAAHPGSAAELELLR